MHAASPTYSIQVFKNTTDIHCREILENPSSILLLCIKYTFKCWKPLSGYMITLITKGQRRNGSTSYISSPTYYWGKAVFAIEHAIKFLFFPILENLRHVACELMCNRYENVSNEVQFIDSVIAMDEWADEFKERMSGRSNSMGYLGIAR